MRSVSVEDPFATRVDVLDVEEEVAAARIVDQLGLHRSSDVRRVGAIDEHHLCPAAAFMTPPARDRVRGNPDIGVIPDSPIPIQHVLDERYGLPNLQSDDLVLDQCYLLPARTVSAR